MVLRIYYLIYTIYIYHIGILHTQYIYMPDVSIEHSIYHNIYRDIDV